LGEGVTVTVALPAAVLVVTAGACGETVIVGGVLVCLTGVQAKPETARIAAKNIENIVDLDFGNLT